MVLWGSMITSLLDSDIHEYNKDMEAGAKALAFYQKHPKLSSITDYLQMRWSIIMEATICRAFGHKLVDDGSYATPDSGGEGWACTRCGRSWWHQYY